MKQRIEVSELSMALCRYQSSGWPTSRAEMRGFAARNPALPLSSQARPHSKRKLKFGKADQPGEAAPCTSEVCRLPHGRLDRTPGEREGQRSVPYLALRRRAWRRSQDLHHLPRTRLQEF
jgi:hypothetical protein